MGNVLYSYDNTVAKDEHRLEHEKRMSEVHDELIKDFKARWTFLDSDSHSSESETESGSYESESETEYEDEYDELRAQYKKLGVKCNVLEKRVSKMTQLTAISMVAVYVFFILSLKSSEKCMKYCEYYDYEL